MVIAVWNVSQTNQYFVYMRPKMYMYIEICYYTVCTYVCCANANIHKHTLEFLTDPDKHIRFSSCKWFHHGGDSITAVIPSRRWFRHGCDSVTAVIPHGGDSVTAVIPSQWRFRHDGDSVTRLISSRMFRKYVLHYMNTYISLQLPAFVSLNKPN